MGEKTFLALVMFVMAYGLAATTFTVSQIPPSCNGDESLLTFCGPYMGNIHPNPTSDCCKAATSVFDKAMATGQGIRDLCNCLRVAGPVLRFQKEKMLSLPMFVGLSFLFLWSYVLRANKCPFP